VKVTGGNRVKNDEGKENSTRPVTPSSFVGEEGKKQQEQQKV
jgi:hypothetical protein